MSPCVDTNVNSALLVRRSITNQKPNNRAIRVKPYTAISVLRKALTMKPESASTLKIDGAFWMTLVGEI